MNRNGELLFSVVIPVYGCKSCLKELISRLEDTLNRISTQFEIILINDASPDDSWDTIQNLAINNTRVKGINFSRNFGQHYAISAGLKSCNGEWVIVMDCDLQDQPAEIINLYNKAIEGFEIVYAQRVLRQDSLMKRVTSKLFYAVLGYLTDTVQDPSIANFGIYHKNVIEAILSMGDYQRYFPTMVRWVGFTYTKIPVAHAERINGESSYTFSKLFRLSTDIILSFSDKPLRLTVKFGFLISLLTFISAIFFLALYIKGKILVPGYTSLIISIWFLAGIIITLLGIVGLYIGKTFDKVKGRPTYIIKNKTF
jgi:polyisoprenyl-phosphate glycosyltransferase